MGDRHASWIAAWAAIAPFAVAGLELITGEIPLEWMASKWLLYLNIGTFLVLIVLAPVGVGIGWARGFPRWCYPYVGQAIAYSLYMMNVATPGLKLFGYTFGSNDLWGWRSWIPLVTVVAIVLLVTRSLRPVLKLFTNAWRDWSLLTFAMFGFMPLIVAISFDEVDRLYSLYYMVGLTLVMVGTAWVYVRGVLQWQRVVALLVGIAVTLGVSTWATTAYWLENGWVNVVGSVLMSAAVALVMGAAAVAELVRCWYVSGRSARTA